MSPEAREHSFDELTRGLASGTVSRRKALRWMGSALVGAALTSIPGVAWAKPKPGKCNNDKQCPTGQVCVGGQCCANEVCGDQCCGADEYCSQPSGICCPFGQPGCGEVCCQSDETCLSGQCCPFELFCGSGGPEGFICCPSGTYCAGADLCCQPDEVRCGNECASCPEGQFLNNACECVPEGLCTVGSDCGTLDFHQCNAQCFCYESLEGSLMCAEDASCGPPCESTAECQQQFGQNSFCTDGVDCFCGGPTCMTSCGTGSLGAVAEGGMSAAGPT